jgi:hypothetical protein
VDRRVAEQQVAAGVGVSEVGRDQRGHCTRTVLRDRLHP